MRPMFYNLRCFALACVTVACVSNRSTSISEPLAPEMYQPGDRNFSMSIGGLEREFIVHVPKNFNRENLTPLVIGMHGGGGNAAGQALISRMSEKADRDRYLVVYPQGTGKKVLGHLFGTWNSGGCCGYAVENGVDDVGFISHMIDWLVQHYNVDRQRVYATGLSNGAMMSERLACELSEKIAAISPVAATMTVKQCRPARAVPMMYFHGTADQCAPYKGDKLGNCMDRYFQSLLHISVSAERRVSVDPVDTFVRKWSSSNRVSSKGSQYYHHGAARCTSFEAEPTGAPLILCLIEKGGHTWPGGSYGAACDDEKSSKCVKFKDIVGPISRDIDATDEMWKFFEKQKLP